VGPETSGHQEFLSYNEARLGSAKAERPTVHALEGIVVDHRVEPRLKRPLGVTIVAVYWFLGAALFLIVLVQGILQPASGSGFFSGALAEDAQHAGAHFGVHVLLIAIFAGIGLGLWSLHSLARRVVLVITGLHLVLQAVKLARPAPALAASPSRPGTAFFWFTTVMSAAIFLYMCTPQVKQAFSRPRV
jgi:hypothetical protein